MTAGLRTAYWSCAKRELYFIRISLAWRVQCYSERSPLPNFFRIYDLGEVKLRHILIALSGIRGLTRGPNVSPALE